MFFYMPREPIFLRFFFFFVNQKTMISITNFQLETHFPPPELLIQNYFYIIWSLCYYACFSNKNTTRCDHATRTITISQPQSRRHLINRSPFTAVFKARRARFDRSPFPGHRRGSGTIFYARPNLLLSKSYYYFPVSRGEAGARMGGLVSARWFSCKRVSWRRRLSSSPTISSSARRRRIARDVGREHVRDAVRQGLR